MKITEEPYASVEVGGEVVKVDLDCVPLLDGSWGVYQVKNKKYVMAKRARKTTYLHRVIADAPQGSRVIFKNLDTLDLRRENLLPTFDRIEATRSGPRANNKSGYKGVSFSNARGMWEAKFSQTVDGKRKHEHLGYFDFPHLAARAYDRRLIEAHGEGAVTNERLGLL